MADNGPFVHAVYQVLVAYHAFVQVYVEYPTLHQRFGPRQLWQSVQHEMAEFLRHVENLQSDNPTASSHYWLFQGQGSLFADGLHRLRRSLQVEVTASVSPTAVTLAPPEPEQPPPVVPRGP